jgi:phospholipid/cholesterol/gamma-HCH transport system substrate-binding protein
METRANYAMVGLFTLIAIFGGFGFAYWIGGRDAGTRRDAVAIIFSGSVSGLLRGGSVNFNGVRVGEVTDIRLMPEDPRLVVVKIEIDQSTPVKADTRARLESQGLTGVASIALVGGASQAGPLKARPNEPMPTIYGDRSDFQDLFETVREVSRKVDGVLARVEQVVTDSEGSVVRTVRNAEKFSQALADNSDGIGLFLKSTTDIARALDTAKVNRIIDNTDRFMAALGSSSPEVETSLKDVSSLTSKLNRSADRVDLVLKSAEDFLGSAAGEEGKTAFTQVGEAARSLRVLADNLDKRTAEITVGINRFTGPGLRDIEALASDSRRTLGDINRVLRSLERNPQQLIFGGKPAIPEYNGRR